MVIKVYFRISQLQVDLLRSIGYRISRAIFALFSFKKIQGYTDTPTQKSLLGSINQTVRRLSM